jgi:hypothetical protein
MRVFLLSASIILCAACGGAGGTAAQTESSPRPARGPADLITEAEISAGVYQNAQEAIQSLRPAMLRARAGTAGGPVVLYIDNVRMLDLTGLATVPANRVREIRFINAQDATTRWGTGHSSGVIHVTTKR